MGQKWHIGIPRPIHHCSLLCIECGAWSGLKSVTANTCALWLLFPAWSVVFRNVGLFFPSSTVTLAILKNPLLNSSFLLNPLMCHCLWWVWAPSISRMWYWVRLCTSGTVLLPKWKVGWRLISYSTCGALQAYNTECSLYCHHNQFKRRYICAFKMMAIRKQPLQW